MAFDRPKFDRNVLSTLQNRRIKFYDLWFDFGSEKKQIVKNGQNCKNFCKKIKFKIRLVTGHGIWPDGPLKPLESACKIV